MRLLFTLAIALSVLVGCSSTKHQVKDVDTELEHKSRYKDTTIGINKDDQVVLQKEERLEVQLKKLVWENYNTLQALTAEHDLLSRCRNEMADPRLGGTGEVTEIPDVDQLKSAEQWQEDVGFTSEGKLRVVKKELYMERLKSERKNKEILSEELKLVKKFRRSCERKMGYARVKVGLPARRYRAKGHTGGDGVFRLTHEAEKNLDDAFRIRKLRGSSPSPVVDHEGTNSDDGVPTVVVE